MNIKKYIFALLLVPSILFAQTDISPNAGLTPRSPFYFLDRLGEVLQELVTFNPETKIRLQVSFAAERIAEIQLDMAAKDVDAKGLNVAQNRLEEHLSKASRLVLEEKDKGKNVDEWEKTIKKEIEVSKVILESSFEIAKDALEDEREEVKKELEMAKKSGDAGQIETFTRKLDSLEEEKDKLEDEREAQKQSLENEKEELDDDGGDDGKDEDGENNDLKNELDEIKEEMEKIEI